MAREQEHSEPASINSALFVYGTLMTSAAGPMGRAQRDRLQREAVSLGIASTRGKLYDLGRYPGLVASTVEADIVHGEVFRMKEPGRSLCWLDAYEGIVPGNHDSNEYARVEQVVTLAGGETVTAFLYLYVQDVGRAVLLPDGRWSSRVG